MFELLSSGILFFLSLGQLFVQQEVSELAPKIGQVPATLVLPLPSILDSTTEILIGRVGDINGDGWNDFALSGGMANLPEKAKGAFETVCIVSGTDGVLIHIMTVRPGCGRFLFDAGDLDSDQCDDLIIPQRSTPTPDGWSIKLYSGRSTHPLGELGGFRQEVADAALYCVGPLEDIPTCYFTFTDGSVTALQFHPREQRNAEPTAGPSGDGNVLSSAEPPSPSRRFRENARLSDEAMKTGKYGRLGIKPETVPAKKDDNGAMLPIEVETSRSRYPDIVTNPSDLPWPEPEPPSDPDGSL